MTGVLDRRTLNRALLARQLLLHRDPLPVAAAIEHLVGMQAQAPLAPYVGLWSRLDGFRTDDLAELLVQRSVARLLLMRGTIHLVTARDALALRPVVQPMFERRTSSMSFGRDIAGTEMKQLLATGRALVAERPRTRVELSRMLGERWPERDAASLAVAFTYLAPLVQVPPRGVWGAGGQATWTTIEKWLGTPLGSDNAPDAMIQRYLAAFGPATVSDMRTWSGLPQLRAVIDRLRPRLRTFRDEHGKELFDVPDAPLPDVDTPAPPRFLPEFDNALLSHADRTRIISDDHRKRISSANGLLPGSVLVDGFFAGIWKISRRRGTAMLSIDIFHPVSTENQLALTDEGDRLLRFVAPDASSHDLRLAVLD